MVTCAQDADVVLAHEVMSTFFIQQIKARNLVRLVTSCGSFDGDVGAGEDADVVLQLPQPPDHLHTGRGFTGVPRS